MPKKPPQNFVKGLPLTPADIVAGIKEVASCIKEVEAQRTERARITSDAKVELARVHAMRDCIMHYLEASFDERRKNFDALFSRFDAAHERGDLKETALILDSIVQLADSSPFKALREVASTAKVLKEKGTKWDL